MKKLIAPALLFFCFSALAQPKISSDKKTPSIKETIEKVARDFYQDFTGIKGDTLNETQSTIEFKSRIMPPGALSASVTKYIDPYSYTWQSTLFESEDYETAAAKYKEYYRQLEGCTLTFYDKSSYKLTGVYDTPDENRAFASSILSPGNANPGLELFKVEIALSYSLPNWEVKVMVYEKVADNKIRPTVH
jgi:hypothetical protein